MARLRSLLLTLCCAAAATLAAAQAPEPWRPRLALALSGGGARGIAHVGALRALEEAGLPVDAIAGNSMGAVVGGIYATGKTAAELEEIVRSLDWAALFSGRPDRRTLPVVRRDDRYADWLGVDFDWKRARLPAGLVPEHRVNGFLIRNLSPASYATGGDFDRLPIPFRAVAYDLGNGERVILAKGDLALAARASMSIPVFFPPVSWEGRKLVDGLVVDNLPTDVAKLYGAAVTVAVDIGSPELGVEEYATSLGVASQVSNLLSGHRSKEFKADPDVYVHPDLGRHPATDYSQFDELIKKGYEAMRESLPLVREKLAAAGVTDLTPRPKGDPGLALQGAPIVEVVTRGNERASERLLRRTFNIPIGPAFDMERGLRAFDKVEASGLLDHCWMEFEPAPGGVRIVLRAQDAPPNRAAFGLAYNEWEKARLSIRLRDQNTLGFGEQLEVLLAASDAETMALASLRGDRIFVAGLGYRATAYALADKPRIFDDEGEELNRAKFERQGVTLALQTSLERWGLLEAGARFGHVKTVPQAAVPLPEASDTVSGLFAGFTIDTLDDYLWPRTGALLSAHAEWDIEGMGASYPSWRLRFDGRLGQDLGRRATVQLDGLAGFSGQQLQFYDQYRVGGPMLIPGYHHEELVGSQAIAGALSLRYTLVGRLRLVARAGAGNVFAETSEIGLDDLRWGVGIGVSYGSRVGPLSLEVGFRNGGASLVSFVVGWY
ncbi:MAG TPA: patatin-like phospholipase family protein [Vicinamibacteria bacterium]